MENIIKIENDKIKVFIDGKEYFGFKNETILSLLKRNNFEIPTFCYDKNLPPLSSCFACIVEIKNLKGFQPACSTYVSEGMEIFTNNKEIYDTRKTNIELLISNHFADCFGPCKLACPANVDIQTYITLAKRGLYKESIKVIKDSIPIPATIGRVCPAFCEKNCRRNYVDESVGINNIKRYIADMDLFSDNPYIPSIESEKEIKIAVIGAGPAGLSVAYYLRIKGYQVDIFEKLPEAGGMLRYGIPSYRLPRIVLDKEIDILKKMGINFVFNKEFGKDFDIKTLRKDNYKAIFIGIGAQSGNYMKIEGENLKNIILAVDFLRNIQLDKTFSDNFNFNNVVIIGGGNTAIDSARTALRLGAKNVKILYRRTREEMPANDLEIEEALEEGIELITLVNPIKFIGEEKVEKIELIKMKLGEPDSSGRRRPIPIEGSNFIIEADYVIEAISQKIDQSSLKDFDLNSDGTIIIEKNSFKTNIEYVFAGGDVVNGPDTVVKALSDGKKAAISIHNYLLRKTNENDYKYEKITDNEDLLKFYISKDDFFKEEKEKEKYFKEFYKNQIKIKRRKENKIEPIKRINNFEEFNFGLDHESFNIEIERCLQCGCNDIFECKLKKYSKEYNIDKNKYKGLHRNEKIDNSSKYIVYDKNKCINCGKCVGICANIIGENVFGYYKRGFTTLIQPFLNTSIAETNCINCGNCINICPTGAITDKYNDKPICSLYREYEKIINCDFCSKNCELKIKFIDDQIIRISSEDIICNIGKNEIINLFETYKYFSNNDLYLIKENNFFISKNISVIYANNIENNNKTNNIIKIENRLDKFNLKEYLYSYFDKFGYDKLNNSIFIYGNFINKNNLLHVKNYLKEKRINSFVFFNYSIFNQVEKLNFLKKNNIKYEFKKISYFKKQKIALFNKTYDSGIITNFLVSAPFENIVYIDKNLIKGKFLRYTLVEDIEKIEEVNIDKNFELFLNIDDFSINQLKKYLKYFKLFDKINIFSVYIDFEDKLEEYRINIEKIKENYYKNIIYLFQINEILSLLNYKKEDKYLIKKGKNNHENDKILNNQILSGKIIEDKFLLNFSKIKDFDKFNKFKFFKKYLNLEQLNKLKNSEKYLFIFPENILL